MRSIFISILLIFCFFSLEAKNLSKIAKEIEDEGKFLYRLEIASWNGTDIFIGQYKKMENVKGYFSYADGENTVCIFFSTGENPRVLGTISFSNVKDVNSAGISFEERLFTEREKDLHTIREKALEELVIDTIFKMYNNTSVNPIPVIYKKEKKVYFLTGPSKSGHVLFGNDYLVTFDKKNNIKEKKVIHDNLISIPYNPIEKDPIASSHIHSDKTGDFITPTDICTLMLYGKYANWKQHYVSNEKYVNIWDCRLESLVIMTTESVRKIVDKN